MSSDKKISAFLSFSFPLCLGLILGLLIFNPIDGFFVWWLSIDWGQQSIANAGAWIAGISTSVAAIATGFAARSSAQAAKAAQDSANNWRQQISFDKYIDAAVNSRIQLRKFKKHLDNICQPTPDIFASTPNGTEYKSADNNVTALSSCISNGFSDADSKESERFELYKRIIEYNTKKIGELQSDLANSIELAFELSESHLGLTSKEVSLLRDEIGELRLQIDFMATFHKQIFEDKEVTYISGFLNCEGANRISYLYICNVIDLLTAYIDYLVINPDQDKWLEAMNKYTDSRRKLSNTFFTRPISL
ncbi:hypothetical protein B4939_18225 [Vibrio cholerae]|uniref:hypothetical protein n=1 Tax=Vibrio cholerae TaxID=666 RepID=UPI001E2C99F5|nr:hypothetical protein [Vibrio cholerae]MCD1209582.1 hypothetical protein [Vibrio cholerae]MCD1231286.1 hypothetical protein [Vibrio cholerae]